jgi:hypothetical protein
LNPVSGDGFRIGTEEVVFMTAMGYYLNELLYSKLSMKLSSFYS